MDACSLSPTVAKLCPAPFVGYRSSVMRVLQTRVVATQEKICGVGINGKEISYLLARVAYPRVFWSIYV